jgi:hypothetical protein
MTIPVASSLLSIIAANVFSVAVVSSASGTKILGCPVVILSPWASHGQSRPPVAIFLCAGPPPARRTVIPAPAVKGQERQQKRNPADGWSRPAGIPDLLMGYPRQSRDQKGQAPERTACHVKKPVVIPFATQIAFPLLRPGIGMMRFPRAIETMTADGHMYSESSAE